MLRLEFILNNKIHMAFADTMLEQVYTNLIHTGKPDTQMYRNLKKKQLKHAQ